jgi:hypothetical protein
MAMKLKTFEGTDIFVDEDGRYSATIDGRTVRNKSLREIEKRLAGQNRPVEALEFDYQDDPRHVQIVRPDSGKYDWRDANGYGYHWFSLYVPAPEIEAQITALNDQMRALRERREALRRGLTRFSAQYFREQQTPGTNPGEEEAADAGH